MEPDELITVGAWMYLVIVLVGRVEERMVVVVGRHAGQSHEVLFAYREIPEYFQSAR